MRKTLSVVLSLGAFIWVNAQVQLPEKVTAFTPKVIAENSVLSWDDAQKLLASSNWGQSQAPSNKRYWVVYSDRDNNHLYESPNRSSRQLDNTNDLMMNDKVRIAQIRNGFALVYEEPSESTVYPAISPAAKSSNKRIGWIPMENLLLWRKCPADQYGIYRKALLVFNVDEVKSKGSNSPVGYKFNNPTYYPNTNRASQIKTGMRFYYIMKEDKETGLMLLADEYNLDATGKHLYGWVAEQSMAHWNQRSCLEPSWDLDDIQELKNTPALVFGESSMNNNTVISRYNYGRTIQEGKLEEYKYRLDGKVLRYPILNNDSKDKENSYKCTVFIPGGVEMSLDAINENETQARKRIQENIDAMKIFNLLIVIDGTRSMEPYYEPVQKAISEACKDIKSANKNYEPRVGLVIYRDYADGKDDPENGLLEYIPLSDPETTELKSYFSTGGKYRIKSSSKDKTYDEAVYQGIWQALDMDEMGYDSKQSNLLVVVGDCGNDESYEELYGPTQQEIIEKCVENRVNMLVFQVHKKKKTGSADKLYDSNRLFNDQMNFILTQNLEAQYAALKVKDLEVKFDRSTSGYDLKPTLNIRENFFLGATRFPDNDNGKEDLKADELKDMLVRNIQEFQKTVSDRVNAADELGGFAESEMTTEQMSTGLSVSDAYMISLIGEEQYKVIQQTKTLMAKTGYVYKKSSSGKDYWKPVIFISPEELKKMTDRLSEVVSVSASAGNKTEEVRKHYVDAMKSILRGFLPGVSEEDMLNMSQDDVVALIAGLNVSTKQLSGRPLREIADPKQCSDPEFRKIETAFKNKVNKLKNLIKENRAYIYDYKDVNSYWIPIEELP